MSEVSGSQRLRTRSGRTVDPLNRWHRLRRQTGFRVACVLLGIVGLAAAAPELLVWASPGSHDPTSCSLRAPDGSYQDRLAPSAEHWFGTDAQGCDEFARVIYGAQTSLSIGIGAAFLLTLIGTTLGLLAAMHGGWVDALVRRCGDVTLGVPFLIGAILLLALLAGEQRSPTEIILTLTALGWPSAARIARNSARTVMVLPFIEASRALGGRWPWILRRHVLPNSLPAVIAFATPTIGLIIGAEAALSFLGVGLQVPSVSWGLMIEQGQRYYSQSPYLLLFPGVLLVAAIAGFLLLGDALNDSLEVQLEV